MIVVSSDPDLFDSVRAALRTDPRFIALDDLLHCDGSGAPLTNIYPVDMSLAEWEGWDSSSRNMPDPRAMSALIFECRSPAWIAEVGRLLANWLPEPVWFVDSTNTAWPAGDVDPDRVALA